MLACQLAAGAAEGAAAVLPVRQLRWVAVVVAVARGGSSGQVVGWSGGHLGVFGSRPQGQGQAS